MLHYIYSSMKKDDKQKPKPKPKQKQKQKQKVTTSQRVTVNIKGLPAPRRRASTGGTRIQNQRQQQSSAPYQSVFPITVQSQAKENNMFKEQIKGLAREQIKVNSALRELKTANNLGEMQKESLKKSLENQLGAIAHQSAKVTTEAKNEGVELDDDDAVVLKSPRTTSFPKATEDTDDYVLIPKDKSTKSVKSHSSEQSLTHGGIPPVPSRADSMIGFEDKPKRKKKQEKIAQLSKLEDVKDKLKPIAREQKEEETILKKREAAIKKQEAAIKKQEALIQKQEAALIKREERKRLPVKRADSTQDEHVQKKILQAEKEVFEFSDAVGVPRKFATASFGNVMRKKITKLNDKLAEDDIDILKRKAIEKISIEAHRQEEANSNKAVTRKGTKRTGKKRKGK